MTNYLFLKNLIYSTKCKYFQKVYQRIISKWLYFFLLYTVIRAIPSALKLLFDLLCQLFVKWYPERHNVMSTCINSFPKRGVQYSSCVCPGTIYLFFSFISEGLQVPLPLEDSVLFCNFSSKTTFEKTIMMSHKTAFRAVIKKVNMSRKWIKMLHIPILNFSS